MRVTNAATVPVTGLCTPSAETYAGRQISYLQLAAGQSVTLSLTDCNGGPGGGSGGGAGGGGAGGPDGGQTGASGSGTTGQLSTDGGLNPRPGHRRGRVLRVSAAADGGPTPRRSSRCWRSRSRRRRRCGA